MEGLDDMMWGYNWGVGWGWMLLGSIMMIAFWVALIWVLYLAVRGATRSDDRGEDARAIAARRLAAGEISHDEYDRIVAKIRS
jgi:putative membrane protein